MEYAGSNFFASTTGCRARKNSFMEGSTPRPVGSFRNITLVCFLAAVLFQTRPTAVFSPALSRTFVVGLIDASGNQVKNKDNCEKIESM